MKIVKIWDADYPWDVRVEKIVTSLIEGGHEVHLVCRNKKMAKTYEYHNGLHIHRLPPITKSSKINEVLGFPTFFSPFWIAYANKVIKEVKPDIVLVRDLPLCLTGWLVAKINRIPVVLDMAENYPEQCKNVWKLKGFKLRNIFVRNPFLAKIVELIAIRLVGHIIVVIDESKKRLMHLGVPNAKISVVINTPSLQKLATLEPRNIPETIKKYNNGLKLIYIGLLDENRGITTVIRALPILKKISKDICFLVIGKGMYEDELKKLACTLNVQDSVIFEGWIDYKLAPLYIHSCDIGIVPHHAIDGWHTTIPNKLFDYMQLSKPVIVSNARATARVVEEEQCGIVFKDNDIGDFIKAVQKLFDPDIRLLYGSNGKKAIECHYNWMVDSKKLINTLETVSSQRHL